LSLVFLLTKKNPPVQVREEKQVNLCQRITGLKRISSPFIFLYAALLFLVGAAVLQVGGQPNSPERNAGRDLGLVTRKTNELIQRAQADINRIQRLLHHDSLSFSALHNKTQVPCFVYRGGQLVYWTNHTIAPELDSAITESGIFSTEHRFGKFIIIRQPLPSNYSVQAVIPLETNYGVQNAYLASGLNARIFNTSEVKLSLDHSASPYAVYSDDGTFLFNMQLEEPLVATFRDKVTMILLVTGIVFFVGFLILLSRLYHKDGLYGRGVAVLILPLFLLRAGLLYFDFPYNIIPLEVFDPKYFASSVWSPSVGDLVLNAMLTLAVAWGAFFLFRKYELIRHLEKWSPTRQAVLKGAVVIGFYLLLLLLFRTYYSIFSNSPLGMDITQNIHFSVFRLLLYGAVLLYTFSLLFATYLFVQTFYALQRMRMQYLLYGVLLLIGLSIIFWNYTDLTNNFLLLTLSLAFFLAITVVDLRKSIESVSYKAYLFIFILFGISAVVGSLAMYRHYLFQLQTFKQKYATNILHENDVVGEFLLMDAADKIKADPALKSKLAGPFVNEEFVKQKILRYYLKEYFDKYETKVKVFDSAGQMVGLVDSTFTLKDYQDRHLQRAMPTDQSGLFLIHSGTRFQSRKYVKMIPIQTGPSQHCTILLELELKRMTPYSVVPELLQDQRYSQPYIGREVSYGIFGQEGLEYAEGDFDYTNEFDPNVLRTSSIYQDGLTVDGTHHFAARSNNGRVLLVTTPRYPVKNLLSNFSFLFLIHTGALILFMVSSVLLTGKRFLNVRTNFSTKIQIFLNFGILIPLILVCVATVSLVTTSYKRDLEKNYQTQGRSIQENLLNFAVTLRAETPREQLAQTVSTLAKFSETDINLYDSRGKLVTTSQPLIFEAGLLSRLINPQAVVAIAENRAPQMLVTEQAGSLRFNSLYLPLRTAEEGQLAGYIGLPFFDSERDLNEKLIELITTVMNIFTIMFIIFMVLTFVAARALTVPLKLITEKLKRTTLTGKNEMLAYTSADEIGLLVNEYNQMLLKLEQSKQELAIREKEAAWREMARQVAHEIKNPLTPMKLSMQYLQRAIAEKRDNVEEMANKISGTIITQIDILSDIATSFSNFTALPELKPEPVDLALVLKRTTDLHQEPSLRTIVLQVPEGEWVVIADENLMFRTFNNLIINALQAIPGDRRPRIEVTLQPEGYREVLISISDNGTGIPEDIHKKVFVPNFSTKYAGSGIGLAVARKGIESAGGSIWFETKEKEGTTFYIKLPLARE
jgi:two-component system, NtrC family, nitrogen regulation sensor histidine kinase NtrY